MVVSTAGRSPSPNCPPNVPLSSHIYPWHNVASYIPWCPPISPSVSPQYPSIAIFYISSTGVDMTDKVATGSYSLRPAHKAPFSPYTGYLGPAESTSNMLTNGYQIAPIFAPLLAKRHKPFL